MNPITIFYSYSHRDEKLRDRLETHLSILKRQGLIQGWHDRKIGAGTEWEGQIDDHLNSSQVILLLISDSFLASDYCYDVEMKRALERHEQGEARVIPVILRPVDWEGAPFGKLQALPTNAKPVTIWRNRDEAFTNVAEGIRKSISRLTGTPTLAQVDGGSSGLGEADRQAKLQGVIRAIITAHLIETRKENRYADNLVLQLTLNLSNIGDVPLYVVAARLADPSGENVLTFWEVLSESEPIKPGARRSSILKIENCVNNPFYIGLFGKICDPRSTFEIITGTGERIALPALEVCDECFLHWPDLLGTGARTAQESEDCRPPECSGTRTIASGAKALLPFPELMALGKEELQRLCDEWVATEEAKYYSISYVAVGDSDSDFALDFGVLLMPHTKPHEEITFPLDELLNFMIERSFPEEEQTALKNRIAILRSKAGPHVYRRYRAMPQSVKQLYLFCKNVRCRNMIQTQYRTFEGKPIGGVFEPITCPRCQATFEVEPGDFVEQ